MPRKTMTKEIKEKKKCIYNQPLPRKKQRCTHYRGRSGKVTNYTEEQIFLYRMKMVARLYGGESGS